MVVGIGLLLIFFFQAEDGIRDLVRSRGLGDVYKRQRLHRSRGRGQVSADDAGDHGDVASLGAPLGPHRPLSLIHI